MWARPGSVLCFAMIGSLSSLALRLPSQIARFLCHAGMVAMALLYAGAVVATDANGAVSPRADTPDGLLTKLRVIRGDMPPGKAHRSPVPGIWGVELSGGNVVYGTADGAYLFAGDLYAIDGELVNLTEPVREARRRDAVAALDTRTAITFGAHTASPSDTLYVFTDVDCPFCQALHLALPKLNDQGITVHYLAYPLAGRESETHRRMASVWCATDPRTAMTKAMAGVAVLPRKCVDPVAEHYRLGQDLGVTATPGVVTEDGRLFSGYTSIDDLVAKLKASQPSVRP